jgi:hypothetical protein
MCVSLRDLSLPSEINMLSTTIKHRNWRLKSASPSDCLSDVRLQCTDYARFAAAVRVSVRVPFRTPQNIDIGRFTRTSVAANGRGQPLLLPVSHDSNPPLRRVRGKVLLSSRQRVALLFLIHDCIAAKH